ncbi:ABC transporter permease [bacterium]|nr:ABC transporter permease [bacterium]
MQTTPLLTDSRPPKIAEWLLGRIIPMPGRELLLGDLDEEYAALTEIKDRRIAQGWYWKETRRAILPILKDQFKAQHHLIVQAIYAGYRIWKREKLFSLVQLFSMGIGLAAATLILSWAHFELNYDHFHDKADRLYRVINQSDARQYPISYGGMGPALERDLPEVVQALRMSPANHQLLITEKDAFSAAGVIADSNFFNFFSFPLEHGDAQHALTDPQSIVLTHTLAMLIFNETAVIGREVKLRDSLYYKVTGVLAPMSEQTHLYFRFILPFEHEAPDYSKEWLVAQWTTYVELIPDSDPLEVSNKITELCQRHLQSSSIEQQLQPVKDIHLRSTGFQWDNNADGDIRRVWLFILAAIAILIMACVNTFNLSITRNQARYKSIQMRRIIGAGPLHLALQASGQSLISSLLAIVVTWVFVILFRGGYEGLMGSVLPWPQILALPVVLMITVGGVLIGLMTSTIPILLIGIRDTSRSGLGFRVDQHKIGYRRRNLVVFQLMTSLLLVLVTVFVAKQLNYMQHYPLGVNIQDVYTVRLWPGTGKHMEIIKHELSQHSAIQGVTSGHLPIRPGSGIIPDWQGQESGRRELMYHAPVDLAYLNFYDLKLVEGKFFHSFKGESARHYVINQAAASIIGPKKVIGKWVQIGENKGTIIGVVKDFHYRPLRYPVQPLIFRAPQSENELWQICFRVYPGQHASAMAHVMSVYKHYSGGHSPIIQSVEDMSARNYHQDKQMKKLFEAFAYLAAIVAGLGLFGLAAYTAERRRHEIVIKKVMGAGSLMLVWEMLKVFSSWLFLGGVLAIPIAYFYVRNWLHQFVRHIDIDWQTILICMMGAWLIVMAVALYWVINAVSTPPVVVLRDE